MRKIIFFLILLLIIGVGAIAASSLLREKAGLAVATKKVLLRVGLVADSHNDNYLLTKALGQLKASGADFVIGLGDYTNTGTTEELTDAKAVFEGSKLEYFLIPGDRDGWKNRENSQGNTDNFKRILDLFPSRVFEKNGVKFVLLDNSDLYQGIDEAGWQQLRSSLEFTVDSSRKLQTYNQLIFVFAHKTPFHPDSNHVMGQDSAKVADQAKKFMGLMEQKKVDGFFSGDLHFFAKFKSPSGFVRMTTIGAVDADRNFQGPRYAVLTVYDDYSWEVEDIEIQ